MMRYCMPLAGLLLAACAGGGDPAVISKISDSSVSVRSGFGTTMAAVDAAATQGCGTYGKTAQSISNACADQYCIRKEHLYACH